jgi:hypothetical protein
VPNSVREVLDKSTLPCLIIAYRRIEGVKNILRNLQASGVKRIFLAIDGPRNNIDTAVQQEIVSWANSFALNYGLDLRILCQKKNLGVAVGVISAIDWFFSIESFGVIIEDDLEISEDFLDFVLQSRHQILSNKDVWMISGDQFFPNATDGKSAVFINYPLVWGWATSSAKWQEIKNSILSPRSYSLKLIFSPVLSFWWSGARRVWDGSVDTWDIPLAYEMILNKRLTVTPPLNLIRNFGFDANAAHTLVEKFPLNFPIASFDSNKQSLDFYFSKSDSESMNKRLEKYVFGVSWFHIFSPFKYFLISRKLSGLSLGAKIACSKVQN